MKFGSLFSGIGCIDLGLYLAGLELAWQCEIEADCRRVLERHWPAVPKFTDVKDVGKHNLEQVDLIAFGSPCQGLSVAGKREGLADQRSNLFFEAVRVVREMRPTFVLWENVAGALSSNNGRDFRAVLAALAECGAVDIAWRILDGQYFGVAQRRRRVWLVADFGGTRAGQILFESDCRCGNPPTRSQEKSGVAGTLESGIGDRRGAGQNPGALAACLRSNVRNNSDSTMEAQMLVTAPVSSKWGKNTGGPSGDECQNLVTHSLRSEGADVSEDGTGRGTPIVTVFQQNQRNEVRDLKDLAGALPSQPGMKQQNYVAYTVHSANSCAKERHAFETETAKSLDSTGGFANGQGGTVVAFQERGRDGGRSVESQENLAYSLNAPQGGGRRQEMNVASTAGVRRLMPVECLRLQGLPDDWLDMEPPLSDSAKYRMIGNGAVVPNVEWIGKRIAKTVKE